jgi:hypothetical protein
MQQYKSGFQVLVETVLTGLVLVFLAFTTYAVYVNYFMK